MVLSLGLGGGCSKNGDSGPAGNTLAGQTGGGTGAGSTAPTTTDPSVGQGNGSAFDFDAEVSDVIADVGRIEEDDAACASKSQDGVPVRVNLVVVVDRSGSMDQVIGGGDGQGGGASAPGHGGATGDATTRWAAAVQGLTDFFTDPGSAEFYASLIFFSPNFPDRSAVTIGEDCRYDYSTPAVELTRLDGPQPLLDVLGQIEPDGGTPTKPAVEGAIRYARVLNQNDPSSQSIIVLVTDGEPGFAVENPDTGEPEFIEGPGPCAGNNTGQIATLVGAAANPASGLSPIPVFVIGLGSELADVDLEQIAEQGKPAGSDSAISHLFRIGDNKDISAELLAAMASIRAEYVPCGIELPQPPDGQPLDLEQINVDFVASDSSTLELVYDLDCQQNRDNAWMFDNPAAPTKIQLCERLCDRTIKDGQGELKVALGCERREAPPR